MHRAPHLASYGYFYDALSGLFLPPSDPNGCLQSLARLMTASFLDGEVSNAGTYEEMRSYRPSWAPISSVVRVCHSDDIRSLTLRGDTTELKVIHAPDGTGSRNVQVFEDDSIQPSYDAPLAGKDYDEIQEAVTELAQKFFDNFPS